MYPRKPPRNSPCCRISWAPNSATPSGGQFNTVIKSGSNEHARFHVRILSEPQPERGGCAVTSNSGHPQQSALRPEQPGRHRVGGPMIKDKLFYFANCRIRSAGPGDSRFRLPVYAPTAAGFAALDKMGAGLSKTNYSIFKQYVPAAPVANGRLHRGERCEHPDRRPADLRRHLHQLLHLPGQRGLQHVRQGPDPRPLHQQPSRCAGQHRQPAGVLDDACRSGSTWFRWRNTTPSRPT